MSDMESRGDEGLPSIFGGSGRGKLWTLVMDNLCGGWVDGSGGRGLRAGRGEGAGERVVSSDTEVTSERAWHKISEFWAASLYCW